MVKISLQKKEKKQSHHKEAFKFLEENGCGKYIFVAKIRELFVSCCNHIEFQLVHLLCILQNSYRNTKASERPAAGRILKICRRNASKQPR